MKRNFKIIILSLLLGYLVHIIWGIFEYMDENEVVSQDSFINELRGIVSFYDSWYGLLSYIVIIVPLYVLLRFILITRPLILANKKIL